MAETGTRSLLTPAPAFPIPVLNTLPQIQGLRFPNISQSTEQCPPDRNQWKTPFSLLDTA